MSLSLKKIMSSLYSIFFREASIFYQANVYKLHIINFKKF